MQDIHTRIAQIQRPRILARAARIGAETYRRDTHLPPLLKQDRLPRSAEALVRLAELEDDLNERRILGDNSYRLTRHVSVLSAIVAEARLLRDAQTQRRAQMNASGSAAFLRAI